MTPEDDDFVLKKLAEGGSDLSAPMLIEFEILTDSEEHAESIADASENLGYSAQVYSGVPEDDESKVVWICVCGIRKLASLETLSASRQQLVEIASTRNGQVESWGTFGNAAGGSS